MRFLITSDLHLTDKPKDAYRFGIFRWLAKQQEKYKPDATLILGDLTDKKDNHSAVLVNRIVDEINLLKTPVVFLMGNHDYINPENPFFRFLNDMGHTFITQPTKLYHSLFVPNTRDEDAFKLAHAGVQGVDYVFLHQCMDGAINEHGGRLNGFSTAPIAKVKPRYGCYAGDIHKPQKVGPVQYLGSPYHVHFGDDFQPRVLLLEDGVETNLTFKAPHKWSLIIRDEKDIINNSTLLPNDQVKLTLELAREEAVEWKSVKNKVLKACAAKNLEVHGFTLKVNTLQANKQKHPSNEPYTVKSMMTAFCNKEGLSSAVREAGFEFLNSQGNPK